MNQENAPALLRPQLLRSAVLRLANRDLAEDAVRDRDGFRPAAHLTISLSNWPGLAADAV